jgi:pyruvate carboxylase
MKVGVPVVPGTPGPVGDYLGGLDFIKKHGFPGMFSSTMHHISTIPYDSV